jgi:hypothetical protein
MRIDSLGKNLDNRRPIDYNKIVEVITNQQPPFLRFGIDEFNECKAYFQLPMTPRTQLQIHAAQAIEKTQLELGKEIDKLLHDKDLKKKRQFLGGEVLLAAPGFRVSTTSSAIPLLCLRYLAFRSFHEISLTHVSLR